ncbi:hypothetical protein DAEQUDRAFT_808645 [Daedalea quercina L-15889]|uniref:Uncharacterized protein n=1 Tax=Daedalea quercina L-15889 TaxID=1314783 RepID=A0A165T9I5_9APHY|nr:hypothetical protein DAEQUDRAFT_808645 [Daedalea quercina L-15889]
MLDPAEVPPAPRLHHATINVSGWFPKSAPGQWSDEELLEGLSPQVSPLASNSSQLSPPSDHENACMSPTEKGANKAAGYNATNEAESYYARLCHIFTPPPQQTRGIFHATVRSVWEHKTDCAIRPCNVAPCSSGEQSKQECTSTDSHASAHRLRRTRSLSFSRSHGIHEPVKRYAQEYGHNIDTVPTLNTPALRDRVNNLHSREDEQAAQAKFVNVQNGAAPKRPAHACEVPAPPPPGLGTRPGERANAGSVNKSTRYPLSPVRCASVGSQKAPVHVHIEEPFGRSGDESGKENLRAIDPAEWDELYKDISAATADLLRRRLRPGEWNAPLVPSPLTMGDWSEDEADDTYLMPCTPTGRLWSSYCTKAYSSAMFHDHEPCIEGYCKSCRRCDRASPPWLCIYRQWLCIGEFDRAMWRFEEKDKEDKEDDPENGQKTEGQ